MCNVGLVLWGVFIWQGGQQITVQWEDNDGSPPPGDSEFSKLTCGSKVLVSSSLSLYDIFTRGDKTLVLTCGEDLYEVDLDEKKEEEFISDKSTVSIYLFIVWWPFPNTSSYFTALWNLGTKVFINGCDRCKIVKGR